MLLGAHRDPVTRGKALLAWYEEHRRDLPWRGTTDPYRILVSEAMLQQTQVSRVLPRYREFLRRFPTAEGLAAAPLSDVLDTWQGLGYPARARRLREAARIVTESGWPRTAADLETLPGVGPYTAAAVASFAFDERAAVVDTNVRRVVSRWRGTPLEGAALRSAADVEMTGGAATWNQAIMELGALVCRPRPRCEACPVTRWCADPSVYEPPGRQERYEGSMRQVRGDVLRAIPAGGAPVGVIADRAGHDADRVADAIDGLARSGLVERDGERVEIAR